MIQYAHGGAAPPLSFVIAHTKSYWFGRFFASFFLGYIGGWEYSRRRYFLWNCQYWASSHDDYYQGYYVPCLKTCLNNFSMLIVYYDCYHWLVVIIIINKEFRSKLGREKSERNNQGALFVYLFTAFLSVTVYSCIVTTISSRRLRTSHFEPQFFAGGCGQNSSQPPRQRSDHYGWRGRFTSRRWLISQISLWVQANTTRKIQIRFLFLFFAVVQFLPTKHFALVFLHKGCMLSFYEFVSWFFM